jgi:uncharacterized OB-fold protein
VSVHVRVCRECGEEYRPEVAVCADCGGELEDRRLGEEAVTVPEGVPVPDAPRVEAPPPRVVFVASRVAEVLPLAEALREAEVAHRLGELPPVADGAPVRYALLVDEEDAAEALRVIGPALLSEEHDAEAEAVETRFAEGRGYVECPACGAHQTPGAVECPECGLGLGAEAATCARCGEPLAEPDAGCAACGAPAPR